MKINTSKLKYICERVTLAVVNSILTLIQLFLFYLLMHVPQNTFSTLINFICLMLLVWSLVMTLKSYGNVIKGESK